VWAILKEGAQIRILQNLLFCILLRAGITYYEILGELNDAETYGLRQGCLRPVEQRSFPR
jgi:hypothetical protein